MTVFSTLSRPDTSGKKATSFSLTTPQSGEREVVLEIMKHTNELGHFGQSKSRLSSSDIILYNKNQLSEDL